MKKRILVFAALAVLLPSPVTEVRSSIARTEGSASQARLTTSVVNQRYCKVRDNGVDHLQLDLDLRYENTGKTTVVLHRWARDVIRQRVAMSRSDFATDRLLLNRPLTVYASPLLTGTLPFKREDFAVLVPGSSFQVRTEITILLRAPDQDIPGAIAPGEYYLQVDVSTSPGANTVPESMLRELAGSAELWSATIRSEPMLLIVLAVQPEDDCSPFAELLQQARLNPNATDQSGNTALMAALFEDNEELFSELLKKRADVNARTANGNSALIIAAGRSGCDAVRELVKRGADVNARSDDGETPLLQAVSKCDAETVRILLHAGADPKASNRNGITPFKLAESCLHNERGELLRLLKP